MMDFSPLATEIRWRVWVTPAHFNRFRILAALLHGTLVRGGFRHVQHVRPNRGPHKRRGPTNFCNI